MKTVAALFVEARGIYNEFSNVDLWPIERDARKYCGPLPVIAHPPCERWSKAATFHKSKPGKEIGNDDGCFAAALRFVRTYGGVLEHPAFSKAFERFFIRRPIEGEWLEDIDGSYVTSINQRAYGHAMQKQTWLLVVGCNSLPDLDWNQYPGPRLDSTSSADERRWHTPIRFAQLLVSIAEKCQSNAGRMNTTVGNGAHASLVADATGGTLTDPSSILTTSRPDV